MAKTKIFELAKELGLQSRDIITFLQKGETKAAQSSIEEEAVQRVRKHFGKSEGEKRIVTEGEMRMGDMPEKKEVQKEIQREMKPEAAKTGADGTREGAAKEKQAEAASQGPVKKKKNIIFVSNPHNSKMQSQKGHQGSAGGQEAGRGRQRQCGQQE